MTLDQFKSWFEGYTEDMTRVPNAKQWKRIKAQVEEIDGQSITHEYITRYYHHQPWYPYWISTSPTYPSFTVTCGNDQIGGSWDANEKLSADNTVMYNASANVSDTLGGELKY